MSYALFLGCVIPARSRNYEISARAVARRLGIELADIPDFACCGFPIKASDRKAAGLLAARNLALAEDKGLNICTLCSSCTSMLTEEGHDLGKDPGLLVEANQRLHTIGQEYHNGVTVHHFARVLLEEIGLERIREAVNVDLKGLKVANHYGCHYLKPSEIYPAGEDPERPTSLDLLLEAVGAKVVHYTQEKDCCGGPVLVADENTSLTLARQKLDHVKAAGAQAINLVCPFCSVMYDANQKGIEAKFQVSYDLPVLYLPQILGLAMGMDPKELGFNLNTVKTKRLTEAILG